MVKPYVCDIFAFQSHNICSIFNESVVSEHIEIFQHSMSKLNFRDLKSVSCKSVKGQGTRSILLQLAPMKMISV